MYLPNNTLLQGGKFKIVRHISSGGFGNTYEGVHTMMDTRVAIKEFFPKMFCNRDENTSHITVATQSNRELVDKLRKKFIEEAKSIFKMNHPNIVKVHDIFEENGTAYYVMDYIDGKSLASIVKQRGALPEVEAVGYIRQVADALKYVHSLNRLHLDIKPGNVMVDANGHAMLIDFGASKHYDMESGENTSTLMGVNTKGYAPVEQSTQSFTKFSPATDIYALGATLYKLLTGITPPDANLLMAKEENVKPLPNNISIYTSNAVLAAMTLIRANRPQNIDAFLSLLDNTNTDDSTYYESQNNHQEHDIKSSTSDACKSFNSKNWWEEEGLVPISTWHFSGKEGRSRKSINFYILIVFIIFIGCCLGFGAGVGLWAIFRDAVISWIGCVTTCVSFCSLMLYLLKNNYNPNILVKRRKELLQTDFVEIYESRNIKYAIVARGDLSNRIYGLLDVKKLRMIIPFKYDRMKWAKSHQTLNVELNNQSFTIDPKENIFK